MFPQVLITFREAIEASLIIGIVLTFLAKTNQQNYKKYVWYGVLSGLSISAVMAIVLKTFLGGLEGQTEQIFEGILMFITAGFISWMILWVHKQKDIVKNLKNKISNHISKGYGLGISILITTSVLREGTEMVLYLNASSMIGQSNQFIGILLGLVLALLFVFIFFRFASMINLYHIFNLTSILLILFAAGLVSHGIHELQEANLLPIFSFDPILNISSILDHKSLFGSFLRTLFGYTSRPTILEVCSYTFYIIFIIRLQKSTDNLLRAK